MSTWVSLCIATGSEEMHEVKDFNYTTNCKPMWMLADPHTQGLNRLHGHSAAWAANVLDAFIDKMEKFPEAFRALNPKSGWGDFDSQLVFLKGLRDACREHPLCTLKVSE